MSACRKHSHYQFLNCCAACEIVELQAKVDQVEKLLEHDGWSGFRNVMYGWCIPQSQVFERIKAALKGDSDE